MNLIYSPKGMSGIMKVKSGLLIFRHTQDGVDDGTGYYRTVAIRKNNALQRADPRGLPTGISGGKVEVHTAVIDVPDPRVTR